MNLYELTTAKLDQYTKAADADYEKAKAAGDYKKSLKRASGMMKASGKKIDNDVKALQKARGVAEATEYGIPDSTPGQLPGGAKMTFGEFKKMWPGVILKRPSGGSLAGSVVADVEGWMNNPKSVWEPLQGVAEGEVTKTKTGIVHKATNKYGSGEEPFNPLNPGKYARDLEFVDKQRVKDLDASMGITWKNKGHKGIEVKENQFDPINDDDYYEYNVNTKEIVKHISGKHPIASKFNPLQKEWPGRDADHKIVRGLQAKYLKDDVVDEKVSDYIPTPLVNKHSIVKGWRKAKGLDEKAPPGDKAERMVKHIKQGYAKDGKLTPKEKSIAYATAWKAHNAGKV